MLRVFVRDLQPHMRLARPVPTPHSPTKYLLQRDQAVPPTLIPKLLELGIEEVWVRYDNLAFLEDVIDVELHQQQRDLYCQIRSNFERFMYYSDANLDFDSFRCGVANLFGYLQKHQNGQIFLDKVMAYDNYLIAHSANVCYLSMLLGMRLDWYLIQERRTLPPAEAKDVVTLGFGSLIHDVGKIRVPKEILDKPGKLTPEEMDEIKKHPLHGYEIVKGKVPTAAAQVVLNHHQRWDGKGYPLLTNSQTGEVSEPLAGKRINVFARIATMADVFDAATSKRVYSDAKPPVQVLHEMKRWNQGYFDPVIERAFQEIVPPFPIGSQVILSNGFTAAIVEFNPKHPCQPRVKPINYPDGEPCQYPDTIEIDLADESDLIIQKVGNLDVRPFLYGIPERTPVTAN